jgi:hypothetical protein
MFPGNRLMTTSFKASSGRSKAREIIILFENRTCSNLSLNVAKIELTFINGFGFIP